MVENIEELEKTFLSLTPLDKKEDFFPLQQTLKKTFAQCQKQGTVPIIALMNIDRESQKVYQGCKSTNQKLIKENEEFQERIKELLKQLEDAKNRIDLLETEKNQNFDEKK